MALREPPHLTLNVSILSFYVFKSLHPRMAPKVIKTYTKVTMGDQVNGVQPFLSMAVWSEGWKGKGGKAGNGKNGGKSDMLSKYVQLPDGAAMLEVECTGTTDTDPSGCATKVSWLTSDNVTKFVEVGIIQPAEGSQAGASGWLAEHTTNE